MSGRREQTILLLEHDDADVFFFRRALTQLKFEGNVRVVATVGEARDYLLGRGSFANRRYYPLPDLIVSDFKVPGRNGFEFLQWLQSEPGFCEIPFVMYSGSANGSESDAVLASGARAFVRKELEFNAAVNSIQQMLTHLRRDGA